MRWTEAHDILEAAAALESAAATEVITSRVDDSLLLCLERFGLSSSPLVASFLPTGQRSTPREFFDGLTRDALADILESSGLPEPDKKAKTLSTLSSDDFQSAIEETVFRGKREREDDAPLRDARAEHRLMESLSSRAGEWPERAQRNFRRALGSCSITVVNGKASFLCGLCSRLLPLPRTTAGYGNFSNLKGHFSRSDHVAARTHDIRVMMESASSSQREGGAEEADGLPAGSAAIRNGSPETADAVAASADLVNSEGSAPVTGE